MQRRLCEMSEAKWSITEAKCLQISHNKYASQRDAISYSMGNLMLSHSAGMHNTDISIAGISKRFHFASLHYIFSAYLPTHIKFLTEFHRIFFGTTCISFPLFFRWKSDFNGLNRCKFYFTDPNGPKQTQTDPSRPVRQVRPVGPVGQVGQVGQVGFRPQ